MAGVCVCGGGGGVGGGCQKPMDQFQWTDFNTTWQECFFGDPLPRLYKPLSETTGPISI